MKAGTYFDKHAQRYDRDLAEALAVTGEGKDFFEHGRIACLAECVRRLKEEPRVVMDYGCGVGSALPKLKESLGAEWVIGVDLSAELLQIAREQFESPAVRFCRLHDYQPEGSVDLVYCNGVFHHVPPEERLPALRWVHASLRPRGLFGLYENNPWNPGTRYVMSRCVFDEDAIPIPPSEARRLLAGAGFEVLQVKFLFFFPRFLGWLRWLEPMLSGVPLGGQYVVLSRKL